MRSGISGSGLRYAVRRSGSAVAYCALSIRCGTRDEQGFPAGIAHFVEHTLFRGTRRKSAGVISSYLDRLGGIFGEKISKGQQLTNWEADNLTEAQKLYAATDAWACVRLYNEMIRMQEEGFELLTPQPPLGGVNISNE